MTESPCVETIFHAALAKPADDRAAYLDKACGDDPGLRRRVDRLLAAHSLADRFLELPVRAATDLVALSPTAQGVGLEALSAWPGDERPLGFLAPSSRPGSLGRIGGYEVLEVVGDGGMGIVLRAFDEKLNRVVAVKTLTPVLASVGSARRRFVREARCAAAVVHDNVVVIHAVEDEGATPYLVMPFVDGGTLRDKIDRDGPPPITDVVKVGIQVAAGLAAAHAQGLVHRDVKPENILLEHGFERVRLTDFGLARVVDDPELTQQGLIAGTPAYMSPEQADGGRVDHRGDLFSLGSLLYTLCVGRPPFQGDTMMGVLKRVCDHDPSPVRELNPDVPEWLEALIVELHAKDPARRPQSATEVVDRLARGASEPRVPIADGAIRGRPPRPPPPRNRPRRLATAALLLLTAGVGATEATGVTNVRRMVIKVLLPNDPRGAAVDAAARVAMDGADLVVTGAGAREIRLKPGEYTVRAGANGQAPRRDPVARIVDSAAPATDAARWERAAADPPAEKQVEAVAKRLQELNPGFDGKFEPTLENGAVIGLRFSADEIEDLTPVRALKRLRLLDCSGSKIQNRGRLSDLTPLRGLPLTCLWINKTRVSDLGPLRGVPLSSLCCEDTRVADLSPLKGMSLDTFTALRTPIKDLSPLHGMPLKWLDLYRVVGVSDLSPLRGAPLQYLNLTGLAAADLSLVAEMKSLQILILDDVPISSLKPLEGLRLKELSILRTQVVDPTPLKAMPLVSLRLDHPTDHQAFLRSFAGLRWINGKPAASFWKDVTAR